MPVAVDLRIVGKNIHPVGPLSVISTDAFCSQSWRARIPTGRKGLQCVPVIS